MDKNDDVKRMEDLADRCERTGTVTSTGFLTPAQLYALRAWLSARPEVRCVTDGGVPGCERQVAFFLPCFLEPEDFHPGGRIRAVKLQACFGAPGHRDYMGAILALGIGREWLGDILVEGDCAYVLCLPSVLPALLELEKAGRITVRPSEIPLEEVPAVERKVRELGFTVRSLRLDAVTGELFSVSRAKAQEAIRLGLVSLNYDLCLKPDAEVREGDVISLRGRGKGQIAAVGGRSRKDRIFVEARRFL